jgi:dihydroorotate dehydrogenase electron transfer subunit
MSTVNRDYRIHSNKEIARDTFAMRFHAPDLAPLCRPGQFLNVLVDDHFDPMLRRQYSVSDADAEYCEILYSVVGKGTAILARLRHDDRIGVYGPLGNSFGYEREFDTALIVAGGIGVAPFPFLTKCLRDRGRKIETFVGARSTGRLVSHNLENVHPATDDGSFGFRGTVVDCLSSFLETHRVVNPRIFACGPNVMLHATQQFALHHGIPCELSLESEMACGVGICQGCPIERTSGDRRYALVCTDGPCFDAGDIVFHKHHSS